MTRFLVVAVLVLLGALPTAAEEFPSRTIAIVNPYPPGGQADLSGRPFAAALAKVLKQRAGSARKTECRSGRSRSEVPQRRPTRARNHRAA